jgi:CheY-like chemotaxis protein
MTAHAMKGVRDKCYDAGMNGYIAKPIDCKELFTVLTWIPMLVFSVNTT